MSKRFTINAMAGGTLFSAGPDEFQNPELYLALFDPVGAFLHDTGAAVAQQTFEVEVHRDEPAAIGLIFANCLFKITDLRKVPLDEFLRGVLSVYVMHQQYSLVGAASARPVTAGVDAEADVPIGYRVETWAEDFPQLFLPMANYSVNAWCVFATLFLERRLGEQLVGALQQAARLREQQAEGRMGTIAEMYELPEDLAATLFFLPEWWQQHGGIELVQRCKARLEPQGPPT